MSLCLVWLITLYILGSYTLSLLALQDHHVVVSAPYYPPASIKVWVIQQTVAQLGSE